MSALICFALKEEASPFRKIARATRPRRKPAFPYSSSASAAKVLDTISRVMDFDFMNEASVMTVSRKSHAALSRRSKARHGAKGLLAHLREQTVSFPAVRRHRLPSK